MWVFGYGSLTWKADFPYAKELVGYVKGFSRRFWQGSEDHRGVPGRPGRVVTLVPADDSDECVWGIAYCINDKDVSAVKSYLDYREKDGYKQVKTTFFPSCDKIDPFELVIYIAEKNNPFFLGPAPLDVIAEQIFHAEGPSGRNDDYLFKLAQTVRTLSPEIYDSHLFQLESIVKAMQNKSKLIY